MNTQNQPLVSIIVPAFNRESLIAETLQSVLEQTYQNWECIIVDDGSTDHTIDVVQKITHQEQRFTFFERNREPKGAPTCRNIGIEISNGEFIIFLDSDDLLANFCLEERIHLFQQNKDKDFLVFDILGFKHKPGDYNLLWNVLYTKESDDLYRFLIGDTPWATPSPIWKKESLLKLGGWDVEAKNWQDWEIHTRSLIIGFKYSKFDARQDCFFRCDHEEIAISNNEKRVQHLYSRVALLDRARTSLEKVNLLKIRYKEAIALQYFRICVFLTQQGENSKSTWSIVKKQNLISPIWFNIWTFYLNKGFYKAEKLRHPVKLLIDKSLAFLGKRHFWANPVNFKKTIKYK